MDQLMALTCPIIVPIVFCIACVIAGHHITERKGFDYGPWVLPCLIVGILAVLSLYMIPSARAPSLEPSVVERRRGIANGVGTAQTGSAICIVIAILAVHLGAWD